MEFIDLVKSRYSVRDYDSRPIEEEKLAAVLEAGRLAPTATNAQPQRIFVVRDEASLKKLRSIARCAFNAPVVLIIGFEETAAWKNPFSPSVRTGDTDAAIVCTHMMLAAAEQGIGSCWVGWFDPELVKEKFDIPENVTLTALLPLGYPSDAARPSDRHTERKALTDTVTFVSLCPVCGEYTFTGTGDICPVCGWEHDKVQEKDPSFAGGANKKCLNDVRKEYGKDKNNE